MNARDIRVFLLLSCAVLFHVTIQAKVLRRDSSVLLIEVVNGSKTLELHDTLDVDRGKFVITAFKFYVGGVSVSHAKNAKYIKVSAVQLIDLSKSNSLEIPLQLRSHIKVDSFVMMIGIDSITHRTAYSNDLDPVNSMYWAWQSGFIQLKIEGQWILNNNLINAVEWHLGGYRWPNSTARRVLFSMHNHSLSEGRILVDIQPLLNQGLNKYPFKIMSPGESASQLMDIFAKECMRFLPVKS